MLLNEAIPVRNDDPKSGNLTECLVIDLYFSNLIQVILSLTNLITGHD